MVLTRRDRKALKQVFSTVTDPTLVKYLDEAKLCVEVNACRAAVVLAWCGVVYHLHRQVELIGFDHFERCYRKKYPSEKTPSIQDVIDLREIKDFRLLELLYAMDILATEEDYTILNNFRDLRNRCAHVGPTPVAQHDVLEWFTKVERFVLTDRGADREFHAPSYVVSLLEDVDYELTPSRILWMIEGIRREDHLPLVDKLIKTYFDAESAQTHRDRRSTPTPRERVSQFWIELNLDEHVKIEANRKIAEKLSKVRSLSDFQAKHLVFWPNLKQSGSACGSQLVANLLSELQSDVDGGDVTEHDVDILKTMSENSTGPNREECLRLLILARKKVYGTENEEALQFIHDEADSLTAQRGA